MTTGLSFYRLNRDKNNRMHPDLQGDAKHGQMLRHSIFSGFRLDLRRARTTLDGFHLLFALAAFLHDIIKREQHERDLLEFTFLPAFHQAGELIRVAGVSHV